MVALYVSRMRDMSFNDGVDYVNALRAVPELVRRALAQAPHIRDIARHERNRKRAESMRLIYMKHTLWEAK